MFHDYKHKILSFYSKTRRMPSYSEIMSLVGFKSKNAVAKLVDKLIEEGVVTKDKQGKLLPARMIGDVPMLGLVEAGIPSVAEEQDLDMISLDDLLIHDKEKTFMLEVKGDSMIEAAIQEGDMVIAERLDNGKVPREGDIVIAEVDGGWTMKYLKYKNGKPFLMPANKNYSPIYPEYDLNIAAIVKGVVRTY